MADTYIDLVNKLRRRFNEVELNTTTWATTVGFDQFTKEAINYAYHDVINAEMEWPFLHQQGIFRTTPGVQLYIPQLTVGDEVTQPDGTTPITDGDGTTIIETPGGLNGQLKQFDYESFYISDNNTQTVINDEVQTVSSALPYSVTPNRIVSWQTDLGVSYSSSGVYLTPVSGDPGPGQYSIVPGKYYIFNAADAGKSVHINYVTEAAATQANVINPEHLAYLDYDQWRQWYLVSDLDALLTNQKMPQYVVKTQHLNQILLSPVPDKIYFVWFEYWLDAIDLSATTDTTLLPDRFNQIIVDGASKYCYEFREDPQLAQMADSRFKAGIQRMRIELINRRDDMKAGFAWYPHGRSYTLNTLR